MGHHAVQTDAREYQRERAEETHELRNQTLLAQVLVQLIVERRNTEDRNLVVDLVDHLPHLRRERRGIRNGADVNGAGIGTLILDLKNRTINSWLWFLSRIFAFEVANDANNFDPLLLV